MQVIRMYSNLLFQRCSSDTLFETVLRNLQEMTQYRTVVRCTTVGSGVWSDEEDVNFTTPLEGT